VSRDIHIRVPVLIELVINLKDKNTIVITERDKDVYSAVDSVIDRAKRP